MTTTECDEKFRKSAKACRIQAYARFGEKQEGKVASLTPGTCNKRLWLLPSGPDQVHHLAMRGDPP